MSVEVWALETHQLRRQASASIERRTAADDGRDGRAGGKGRCLRAVVGVDDASLRGHVPVLAGGAEDLIAGDLVYG